MENIDFEKLKESIEQKMTELNLLQELYIKETGQRYYPPVLLKEIDEDLRNYCTEW